MNTHQIILRSSSYISYIFHPLILLIFSSTFVSTQLNHSISLGIRDTTIFLAGLTPALIYAFSNKKRNIRIYHQTALPLFIAGLIASFTTYVAIDASISTIHTILITLLIGTSITIINYFWDISYHASVPMGCAAMSIPFSTTATAILTIIGLIVGLARIPTKKHTLPQVVLGWFYGFCITLPLVWILIKPYAAP